jgi:hypothetical protein
MSAGITGMTTMPSLAKSICSSNPSTPVWCQAKKRHKKFLLY